MFYFEIIIWQNYFLLFQFYFAPIGLRKLGCGLHQIKISPTPLIFCPHLKYTPDPDESTFDIQVFNGLGLLILDRFTWHPGFCQMHFLKTVSGKEENFFF
jgi:hypothetical protein